MRWRRDRAERTTLECPGVFRVLLPAAWTSTGRPGQYYELSPPAGGPDVAVSITVFPLTEILRDAGTKALLERFAAADRTPAGFTAATMPDPGPERTFGRWRADGRTWFGGALFCHDFLVVASSNSEAGDGKAYTLGEQLIAAIHPL